MRSAASTPAGGGSSRSVARAECVRTLLHYARMATVSISRSDLFPVGQSVGIYPRPSRRNEAPPTSAAVASGTVDAAGNLSVTNAGILSYTAYVAYALVNGEHRYAQLRSTLDVHGSTIRYRNNGSSWPAVVAARRSADGTS